MLLGGMQTSIEHFTTMNYAKFVGQTECIMGNWKIENDSQRWTEVALFVVQLQTSHEISHRKK